MANAVQSALARGLARLASPRGNGEVFRLVGGVGTFSASLSSQTVPDGLGGRIVETVMLAIRSAFSSLPSEGAVIEAVDGGASYRVCEIRPAAAGYINIIVRHEVR